MRVNYYSIDRYGICIFKRSERELAFSTAQNVANNWKRPAVVTAHLSGGEHEKVRVFPDGRKVLLYRGLPERYVEKETDGFTETELCDAATYVGSFTKNPYLEELCRRFGNLKDYYREPVIAAQKAAAAYGMRLL